MYAKILVPMSLEHGIGPAALMAARSLLSPGGSIIALHVHEAPPGSVRAYLDEGVAERAFAATRETLERRVAGEAGVTPVALVGHAARTIIDYARETGADCIVIASHKPGMKDYFLGSTASRVVRHAPCAVHVLRGPGGQVSTP